MKVRRKPLEGEAWQFNTWTTPRPLYELEIPEVLKGQLRSTSYSEVARILGTSGCSRNPPFWDHSVMAAVDTSMGVFLLEPGDWIVKDETGIRPCSNEVFRQVYEEIA